MPMNRAASQMLTLPAMAREIPTARASMDVATAMTNMVLGDRSALFSSQPQSSSSLPKASFSMFTPIIASKTNATQWSMD